ncbi:MAG: hypothetical protein ABGY41_02725, partial [Candidatus Poribacteria bacterium]
LRHVEFSALWPGTYASPTAPVVYEEPSAATLLAIVRDAAFRLCLSGARAKADQLSARFAGSPEEAACASILAPYLPTYAREEAEASAWLTALEGGLASLRAGANHMPSQSIEEWVHTYMPSATVGITGDGNITLACPPALHYRSYRGMRLPLLVAEAYSLLGGTGARSVTLLLPDGEGWAGSVARILPAPRTNDDTVAAAGVR